MIKPNNASNFSWSERLIDRLAYAHDASMYRLVPKAIAHPKSEEDINSLLSYANDTKTPLTFRTSGTSLSGQSVTNGILAEITQGWEDYKIIDNGNSIELEPGVIGARANIYLSPYQKRIGPDPASLNAARIGGIISNNSSGMVCGVKYNSYHTMKNIRFILPNGNKYDTSIESDYEKFINSEEGLCSGLINCKKQIENKSDLSLKIREKYKIKNTLGYSLNSFMDFDHPLDIFSHLIIGSEGTLAFCSKIELNTINDPPLKTTGLALFDSVEKAISALTILKDFNADAIELMDDASLRTAKHFSNAPYDHNIVKDNSAGLLFEFQKYDNSEIELLMKELPQSLISAGGNLPIGLSNQLDERMALWRIRKGLYPTVGALRKKGTSVINEDICFNYKELPKVVKEIKSMCRHWNFNDTVLFGHAKDGNLHFAASIDLNTNAGYNQFEGLMNDLVDITVGKHNGSLKAEHGTGRNMAPFVEYEWGGELLDIMWNVKNLTDPNSILNPDVLLTKDNKIHLKNIKKMPIVDDQIDLCVECGFCEPICPSKEITMTPRQRIVVQREIAAGNADSSVLNDFIYDGIDTCATDGLCELACPVNINTGSYVKSLKEYSNSALSEKISILFAKNFSILQSMVRNGLALGKFLESIFSTHIIKYISKFLNKSIGTPIWHEALPKPSPVIDFNNYRDSSSWVFFPTCISRTFSGNSLASSTSQIILDIAEKTGQSVIVPKKINNTCCSQPFSSKGYANAAKLIQEKTIDILWEESKNGSLPIIIDTSPCTHQFLYPNKNLDKSSLDKLNKLKIIDIIKFLSKCLEKIDNPKLSKSIVLHPTCSTEKMEETNLMKELAEKCATNVTIPYHWGCCGFAGDKGLNIPELNISAISPEINSINNISEGYSTSRTCEIGMMSESNIQYRSIAYLVNDYLNQTVN